MFQRSAVPWIACLASVVIASWYWADLRTLRLENDELRAQLQRTPAAPDLTRDLPATSCLPVSPPPSPAVAVAAEKHRTPVHVHGTEDEALAYQRRLLEDPGYRDAWRTKERLNLARRRDNAIRIVGLTPEEADAVIDVYVDQRVRWQQRAGMSITPEVGAEEERVVDSQLREILDDDKRARWARYMATRGTRLQVDQLRAELAPVDGLRDDQVEPLIAALHVEHAQMKRELEEYRDSLRQQAMDTDSWQIYGAREIELLEAAHLRMRQAASSLLTPGQLAAFDRMLERELERQRIQQRMRRLQTKISVGPSAGN